MCGTSNPKVISNYLGISYQAAKNYMNGRLPEASVLIRFAEKTPVSIHWLLTGEGDKFVDNSRKTEAELLASVLSEIAEPRSLRKMFEVLSRDRVDAALANAEPTEPTPTRKVRIKKSRIRKEKETTPDKSILRADR